MTDLRTRIGEAIRREREARGMAASELARRAGVSKATISQLESGAANPTVETLWSIGDALGLPFSALVDSPAPTTRLVRLADATRVPAAAAHYTASLLSASPPHVRRDIYLIQAEPGSVRESAPHRSGTVEHVVLLSGAARVGAANAPEILSPGDYLTYPGDVAHVFEALDADAAAVLISEQA